MKIISDTFHRVEKFLGSLRFAVIALITFSVVMAIGTFCESYYGTEFANLVIYKSWPFLLVQFMLFLSILCATLLRLPPRKQLYGFYVIHAGLLTIFIGAFITYYSGVDGLVTLVPGEKVSEIELPQTVLKYKEASQEKIQTVELPSKAFKSDLDLSVEAIKIGAFIPFSELKDELVTIPENMRSPVAYTGRYRLSNPQVTQDFILTLNPHAPKTFRQSTQMGPLTVQAFPAYLYPCFPTGSNISPILFNKETMECIAPTKSNFKNLAKSEADPTLQIQVKNERLIFYPRRSAFAHNIKGEKLEQNPWRLFDPRPFESHKIVFIFENKVAYFDDQQWHKSELDSNQVVTLPWMNLKLKVLESGTHISPQRIPFETKPIQKNGSLITGKTKALQIEMEGKHYWVTDDAGTSVPTSKTQYQFILGKKTINLPFALELTKFDMQKDPGTENPATYESFVKIVDANNLKASDSNHIFMNNPLKYQQFTFYQSSYFEANKGQFGSILSVNYDPGRPLKYIGCLMLVLGSIWHYGIRSKGKKKSAKDFLSSQEEKILTTINVTATRNLS